jgi:hypothetical protein
MGAYSFTSARSVVGFVGDDDDWHFRVGDHALGESVEEEASGAAVAVVPDDDEVDAVFVCVVEEVFCGVVAFDDDVVERDADAFGPIGYGCECLFEVVAGGVDRFGSVGFGLGVCG